MYHLRQPGAGRSSTPLVPTSMGEFAASIAVLDAVGIDSAHVYGLSMGGMIALEVALRFPDRVRGLVLSQFDRSPSPCGIERGPRVGSSRQQCVRPICRTRRWKASGRLHTTHDTRVRTCHTARCRGAPRSPAPSVLGQSESRPPRGE
ncbi:MAG: alpha/beta fold hydrolase, partial [Frankiaceae bacterium]